MHTHGHCSFSVFTETHIHLPACQYTASQHLDTILKLGQYFLLSRSVDSHLVSFGFTMITQKAGAGLILYSAESLIALLSLRCIMTCLLLF